MKHYGKLTAAAAAGFMTLSAMGVSPVFATDGQQIGQTATIGKTMTTSDGLTTPTGTSFSFTATPKTGDGYVTPFETAAIGTKFTGVAGAFEITNAVQNDKTSTTDVIEFNSATVSMKENSGITIPGIYCYTVAEESSNLDGVTSDTKTFEMQVLVVRESGNLVVSGYTFLNADGTKADNPTFINAYDPDPAKITKTITGNQANMDATFPFDIVITGKAGTTYTYQVGNGEKTTVQILAEQTTVTIPSQDLGNNGSITIDGLTNRDSFTVTETYGEYTPSVKKDGTDSTLEKTVSGKATYSGQGSDGSDTHTIAFTNRKEGTVPTGILMTAAPYAGLVALGGVFAGLFFRRKRED
ncbi:QVPTGV class sortase B protein-sorting domain-containing protein [Faecalibaculum rodentium]|uniref:QVPTGV class sortase B protein-sorting domain-containing protein n=1 Tax=Faecalibaculum rodentium TaxID=1702221 RepID=UPI00259B018F|nr:QVPTGV class sortase B protein-sorting domain-containing protein [Faecalibaculum rodentium]